MECPHCGEPLPSKTCPRCGEAVPEESRYCLACGAPLDEEVDREPFSDDDEEGLDLENRVLCPDGACTGIIENGRCTECGRTYEEAGEGPEEEPEESGEEPRGGSEKES